MPSPTTNLWNALRCQRGEYVVQTASLHAPLQATPPPCSLGSARLFLGQAPCPLPSKGSVDILMYSNLIYFVIYYLYPASIIECIGVTLVNYIGFRYTILQYIICILYSVRHTKSTFLPSPLPPSPHPPFSPLPLGITILLSVFFFFA